MGGRASVQTNSEARGSSFSCEGADGKGAFAAAGTGSAWRRMSAITEVQGAVSGKVQGEARAVGSRPARGRHGTRDRGEHASE